MEVVASHRTLPVTEPSQPSAARFLAHELSEQAGLGEADAHRAGIIATELATNLVKHARGGEILGRVTARGTDGEIELIAVDRGPGMADVSACLVDGHSTSGSSGTGLGAVRRLSDTFDIHSAEGRGSAVVTRIRAGRRAAPTAGFVVAGVSVPSPGEQVCGDAWSMRQQPGGAIVVVVDGLGHGLYASEAAIAALHAFSARAYRDNVDSLQSMHDGLRHTRGAAAAIAYLRSDEHVVKYAGVGNISTAFCENGAIRQGVSHNGTLGHGARVFREYSYPWSSRSLFVMHSDGLASHWSLDGYRGLALRHPALVAAVLYRDHARGRDDVTVVVGREAA